MNSIDNPRQPLTSSSRTFVKYSEMRPDDPSNSRNSTGRLSVNQYELRRLPTRQRRVVKKSLMANVGYRLAKRKQLHIDRRLVGDLMCFLGLLGIVLMIIECEITFNNLNHKMTTFSLFIKATITFSTIILVGLVIYYHRLDLNLYCVDNSIDDWRIALTKKKTCSIILEALICAIHPIPGHFIVEWSSQYVTKVEENFRSLSFQSTNETKNINETNQSYVPIDVVLSLPMFCRLYLICRLIMLRSHLVRDASSQSLGYLNRVSFTFPFVIKSYVQQHPAVCLTSFCITSFFIASWSMRACDYNVKTGHMSLLDATWLFIISFTTIGYGDIVPSTYCGRVVTKENYLKDLARRYFKFKGFFYLTLEGIAALTGLIGVFSTALLVAVISQKLELTRSEKYVHNFVTSIQLVKAQKAQAANVVKFGWKIWFLKRRGKHLSLQYIQAQRNFLTSIHYMRKIKQQQRKLNDNCITLAELFTVQRTASTAADETSQRVLVLEKKVDQMEDNLIEIRHGIVNLQDKINLILDRLSPR